MSNFKVGDRVKAKHCKSADIAEFTVINVTKESLEGESFYYWCDEWIFEVLERPWELPTEDGIYVNEKSIEYLGRGIRVWQRASGVWVEFDSTKTPEEVVENLTYRKINLVRLQAA